MSKLLLDLSDEEEEEEEDSLRKKKLENEMIWDKIKDVHEELDISQQELEKLLLIFHLLLQYINSEENLDNTGGIPILILKIVLVSF